VFKGLEISGVLRCLRSYNVYCSQNIRAGSLFLFIKFWLEIVIAIRLEELRVRGRMTLK